MYNEEQPRGALPTAVGQKRLQTTTDPHARKKELLSVQKCATPKAGTKKNISPDPTTIKKTSAKIDIVHSFSILRVLFKIKLAFNPTKTAMTQKPFLRSKGMKGESAAKDENLDPPSSEDGLSHIIFE